MILGTEKLHMAMVDRYRKSGGFNELLKVLETCNAKKREQIMGIIHSETPEWALAIEQKSISFSMIISWEPSVLLDIISFIPTLQLAIAFKSLPPNEYEQLLQKLSPQERRKIEIVVNEIKPNPADLVSGVFKVVGEVRDLIAKGVVKVERFDPNLHIPNNFEASLVKSVVKLMDKSSAGAKGFPNPSGEAKPKPVDKPHVPFNLATETRPEVLRNKIRELSQQLALVLQQNIQLKEELESKNKAA
jgi:FliG C-terminal domain